MIDKRKMFDCFDYDGVSKSEALKRWKVKEIIEQNDGYRDRHIIYPQVTDMFGLDIIETSDRCTLETDGEFCGLYVLFGGNIRNSKMRKC